MSSIVVYRLSLTAFPFVSPPLIDQSLLCPIAAPARGTSDGLLAVQFVFELYYRTTQTICQDELGIIERVIPVSVKYRQQPAAQFTMAVIHEVAAVAGAEVVLCDLTEYAAYALGHLFCVAAARVVMVS